MTDTITLNEGQQLAHDKLVRFARGEDTEYHMMLLKGYAGTGKTTTLVEVVNTLLGNNEEDDLFVSRLSIAATAPTHKAVRVMKKFSRFKPGAVTFTTIHALLGLRRDIDERTGKEKYVPSKDPNASQIGDFDLILVDESSMLADDLFDLLLPYAKSKFIIFIGDPVQIPPVNHADSKPFQPENQLLYNIGVVELDKIMRQSEENPILTLATDIRMDYKRAQDFVMETRLNKMNSGIITLETDNEVKTMLEEYFNRLEFQADPDYVKVVAYRNAIVNGYNNVIRQMIYKADNLPMIMQNEKLIMDKPLFRNDGKPLLVTNEEIAVRAVRVDYVKKKWTHAERTYREYSAELREESFKVYQADVSYTNDYGTELLCTIDILHESEQERYNKLLDSIRVAAIRQSPGNPLRKTFWQAFYRFSEMFAQVKYNYALTAHKSQGSTYQNVFLVNWDINKNPKIEERNRIRYVGVTRAKDKLFIVK